MLRLRAQGGLPETPRSRRKRADRAYRRAWWALAFYPVSFVAAFVVGEGLLSLLAVEPADAAVWEVLLAAVPALLVLVAVLGLGLVGLNVLSYLVGLAAG